MKIAVDVMGTDYGPQELVLGAVQAVRAYDCEVVLVGDSEIIKKLLVEYNAADERKSQYIIPAKLLIWMNIQV